MRVGALKLKLQIACGDGFALGPGKADVLDAIDRVGSIAGAARATGMSYRRTWLLVDEMNRSFRARLVETRAGGGRERGASLTALGCAVLKDFRALEAESAALAGTSAYHRLIDRVRDTPLPPKAR